MATLQANHSCNYTQLQVSAMLAHSSSSCSCSDHRSPHMHACDRLSCCMPLSCDHCAHVRICECVRQTSTSVMCAATSETLTESMSMQHATCFKVHYCHVTSRVSKQKPCNTPTPGALPAPGRSQSALQALCPALRLVPPAQAVEQGTTPEGQTGRILGGPRLFAALEGNSAVEA